MKHLPDLSDNRFKAFCPYCGSCTRPKNRDHIPSKVLLDDPLPPELPIIYPCKLCNESYSFDEEYVACLIECMMIGSTSREKIRRKKIRAILDHTPSLTSSLRREMRRLRKGILSKEIIERIERILLKLARGHVAFESGEPILRKPTTLTFVPLAGMEADKLRRFESPPGFNLCAEVGSRAIQRQIQTGAGLAEWIIVQPGRYRYIVLIDERIETRVVLSEYLACIVVWENPSAVF